MDSYSRQKLYDAITACEKVAVDAADYSGGVQEILSTHGAEEIVSSHVREVGEALYLLRNASKADYEELKMLVGPTVDLLRVIQLRNILTHRYYDIDWDLVWEAIIEWIPVYLEAFEAASLRQCPPGR